MTKYDDSSKPSEPLALCEVLEFPDGRDFVPVVNRRPPQGFLDFCASYLEKLRQRPDWRRRRLENRCEAEFDLAHPEHVKGNSAAALLDELLNGL